MKCKKCGAENLDDAKFCSSCGSRLDAKYCQKCGKVNPDNAKFCNYCGNLLDSEGTNEENVEYNQENTIRCRICGHINPNTENYCKLCGSQLTPNNGPQATYSAISCLIFCASVSGSCGTVIACMSAINNIESYFSW